MANIANMTVKKADGTTDAIFTAVKGSNGIQPAEWRGPTGAAPAHKQVLRIKGSSNKAGTVQRLDGVFVHPQTATALDGSITVVNRAILAINGSFPQSMPQTEINECVHQALNLYAHIHVKTQFMEGFPAV